MQHKLITARIAARLAANGIATRAAQAAGQPEPDHCPVLKIFNPYGRSTWLFTESDPDNSDWLFGLCDPGLGFPELGTQSRTELEACRINVGPFKFPLERDAHFSTDTPLSVFTANARSKGHIAND
jgi:hypothetical protein